MNTQPSPETTPTRYIQLSGMEQDPLRAAVMQCLGAASMCWEHPGRAGVFQPERAIMIGDQLVEFIRSFDRAAVSR